MEILNSPYNHFQAKMNGSHMFYKPTYDYGHYENRSSQQLKRKHDFMDVVAETAPSFVIQKKPFRTRNYVTEVIPSKIEEIEDEPKKKDKLEQNQLISFPQPTTLLLDPDFLGNLVLSSTIYKMNPSNGKELIPVHTSKSPTLTPNGRFSAITPDRHRVILEDSEGGPRIVEIKEEDVEPRIVEITDEEEKEINESRSRKRREPVSPTPLDSTPSFEDAMDLD
jgi:hypothetical protein